MFVTFYNSIMLTQIRIALKLVSIIRCRSNEVFCIGTGLCAKSCEPMKRTDFGRHGDNMDGLLDKDTNKDIHGDEDYMMFIRCSPNEIFCVQTGTCSRSCDSFHGKRLHTSQAGIEKCSPGETFCLQTGKCSKNCNININVGERAGLHSVKESCDDGKTFCMTTGRCQFECGQDNKVQGSVFMNIASTICRPHEKFCMTTGKCSKSCNDDQIRTKETDDDKEERFKKSESCKPGHYFCLKTGQCERNCNLGGIVKFHNYGSKAEATIQCHPPKIFCMNLGKCARKCNGENVRLHDGMKTEHLVQCGHGETFCIQTGEYNIFHKKDWQTI